MDKMTVYCVKCGKAVDIYPDGRGLMSTNLIEWIGELGEKCNDCRLTKAVGNTTIAGINDGEQFPVQGGVR